MSNNAFSNMPLVQFLPNLCTTMTLFFGFLSITNASLEHFDGACLCIVIAWVADCLDGRVARMTGSESEFGKQYDSLADLIAFGLAPALLCYRWLLIDFHKLGWCLAFVYLAATGLRLARFNTQQPQKTFTGLPCPGAAAVVVSYVWLMLVLNQSPVGIYAILTIVQLVLVSFFMVSHLEFKHMKYVQMPRKYRLPIVLMVALLLSAVVMNPPLVLYVIALSYALYGFLGNYFCFGRQT